MKLSLVVPIFNEEKGLTKLFDVLNEISSQIALQNVQLEVVAVDNHSQDNTWALLNKFVQNDQSFDVIAIQHPTNLGMQQSLLTGIKHSSGDAIAVLQSDLQDPPSLIPFMVAKWREGAKFVASRIEKRKGAVIPRIGAWGFYRLMAFVSDSKVIPDLSDFYLFDSSLKGSLINDSGTTPFIRMSLSAIQLPDEIIRYERDDRDTGSTNFNLTKRVNFAVDALVRNLGGIVKKLILLAICIAFISAASLIALLVSYIAGYRSPVNGWLTSTGLLLIILSAVMIIGAASLEILSRIYRDLPRIDIASRSTIITSKNLAS